MQDLLFFTDVDGEMASQAQPKPSADEAASADEAEDDTTALIEQIAAVCVLPPGLRLTSLVGMPFLAALPTCLVSPSIHFAAHVCRMLGHLTRISIQLKPVIRHMQPACPGLFHVLVYLAFPPICT